MRRCLRFTHFDESSPRQLVPCGAFSSLSSRPDRAPRVLVGGRPPVIRPIHTRGAAARAAPSAVAPPVEIRAPGTARGQNAKPNAPCTAGLKPAPLSMSLVPDERTIAENAEYFAPMPAESTNRPAMTRW